MRRVLISAVVINLLCAPVFALNFDMSADDEIRKEYNPSKLEQDMGLPPLPKVLQNEAGTESAVKPVISQPKPVAVQHKTKVQQVSSPVKTVKEEEPTQYTEPSAPLQKAASFSGGISSKKSGMSSYAMLHKGTTFWVESLNQISDKTRRGTRVSFVSLYPITTTFLTIPMGTVFSGKVVDSHSPQLGNNGGLVVINIDSMKLNSENKSIKAHVIRVNSKHIYYNNIKGKRGYFRNMYNSAAPGRHFCGKMFRVTRNLSRDGSSILLAPFAVAMGVFAWGANVFASPVLANFHRGKHVSIDAGSKFKLKLNQDVIIYN